MTFVQLNPAAGIQTIVSMAFGANPDGDPATWTWTDVSAYVRGAVTITKGRGDYARTADATRISFTLNNTDGRFTPGNPLSPYWPNVVRNVPVRVQLTGFGDPLVAPYERATAFVDQWPITPNAGVIDVISQVTASGKLRRYQKGTKALRSALTRFEAAVSGLVAQWPLEDGSTAAYAAAASTSVPALSVHGAITFASDGPAGSKPLPDFSGGGWMSAALSGGSAGSIEVGFTFKRLQTTDPIQLAVWRTSTGVELALIVNSTSIQFNNSGPGFVNTSWVAVSGIPQDTNWHVIQCTVKQNGADFDGAVAFDGQLNTLASFAAGATLGSIRSVEPGLNDSPTTFTNQKFLLGQLYVASTGNLTPTSYASFFSALSGYTGETAAARVTRVCAEQGVRVTVSTGSLGTVQPMGPQPIAAFMDILHDAETTDQAFLHDGGPNGDLAFLSNNTRYNATVAATLRYKSGHLGDSFAGIFDDQRLVNDATASRSAGSNVEYVLSSSVLAEGEYDEGVAVNVAADTQLAPIAQSRVAVGTVADMRYPLVEWDMIRSPALAQQAVTIVPGSRFVIPDLPTPPFPPGTVDQFVEQIVEVVDARTWRMSLTCSPATPFRAAVVQDSTNPWLVDAGSSALNAGINTTAVSFAVKTTSGPLWSTSGGDYPVDVLCDGEVMRFTAMSGGTSPQTATVIRSINGIVKAHNANAVVSLYRPALIAL